MNGSKISEVIIGALLTALCTVSAYYLHTMNENIAEVKRAYDLGNYRIGILETDSRECKGSIEDLRRHCKRQ